MISLIIILASHVLILCSIHSIIFATLLDNSLLSGNSNDKILFLFITLKLLFLYELLTRQLSFKMTKNLIYFILRSEVMKRHVVIVPYHKWWR